MSVLFQQLQMNLVPLGTYTSEQDSPVQSNVNGHGLKVYVFLQANPGGLGSITAQLVGIDQGSNQTFLMLASVALTAAGLYVLTLFPGIAVAANQSASDALPLSWQVKVIANNANPVTYQVDCDIIS